MYEAISVSCVIDKLSLSWKDFKHTLKHKKGELTLVKLGSHLRIEKSLRAQEIDKPQRNNVAGILVVNILELNNSTREILRLTDPKMKNLGDRGIDYIFTEYAKHYKAFKFYVIEPNEFISINSIIKSRDAIFDENIFLSTPRPIQMIPNTNETDDDIRGEHDASFGKN
ncbi:hypothetical protein Tco_1195344 [Tanacetum coccineum]